MATQEVEISEFAFELGADVKTIYGLLTGAVGISTLTNLKTSTKANLVAAINEVFDLAKSAGGGAGISDGTTSTTSTWSSTKIDAAIGAVAAQVGTILAGSPDAYNTFKELADYVAADTSGTAAMAASIQNRLRVDADQTFTADQLTVGLANLAKLGVAKQSDLQALKTAIGSTTTSYKNIYLSAKNS